MNKKNFSKYLLILTVIASIFILMISVQDSLSKGINGLYTDKNKSNGYINIEKYKELLSDLEKYSIKEVGYITNIDNSKRPPIALFSLQDVVSPIFVQDFYKHKYVIAEIILGEFKEEETGINPNIREKDDTDYSAFLPIFDIYNLTLIKNYNDGLFLLENNAYAI